jgi:hypothetical protein
MPNWLKHEFTLNINFDQENALHLKSKFEMILLKVDLEF